MVAKIDNLERTVDDTTVAVNTLMLLLRVGRSGGGEGEGEKRLFRCKTCMKGFSSFQALGGHRASHTKPIHNSSDDRSHTGSSIKKVKTTPSHLCPICGVDFPMGQALGGHMRKHRNEKEELVTRSFLPEEASSTVTTLKKSSSGKRAACLDLGLHSTETHLNLNLELGLSIS